MPDHSANDLAHAFIHELFATISALQSRVETLERELGNEIPMLSPGGRDIIEIGDLWVNRHARVVKWRGERIPQPTITEWRILMHLISHPGYVRSREQLVIVTGLDEVNDRTIDSHVKRLRVKFKAVDPDFCQIETIYGDGYKWARREMTAQERRQAAW